MSAALDRRHLAEDFTGLAQAQHQLVARPGQAPETYLAAHVDRGEAPEVDFESRHWKTAE